jgi:hypothetical protein
MKYTILFLFTFGACCIVACKPTCEVFYIFEVPNHIYSIHDTLSIGDTLWVESNFSDNLYDKQSGNRFVITPDKLKVDVLLRKMDTTGTFNVLSFFNIYNVVGGIRKGNSILSTEYKYESHTYSIKTAIIPMKKGLFSVYFNSQYDESGFPLNFEDKCDNEKGFLNFKTNTGSGNNYNLVKNNPQGGDNLIEEYYHKSGRYTFVVK